MYESVIVSENGSIDQKKKDKGLKKHISKDNDERKLPESAFDYSYPFQRPVGIRPKKEEYVEEEKKDENFDYPFHKGKLKKPKNHDDEKEIERSIFHDKSPASPVKEREQGEYTYPFTKFKPKRVDKSHDTFKLYDYPFRTNFRRGKQRRY